MARSVGGAASFEEAARDRREAERGPKVPRLKPQTVRAFPENPHKEPWKGPTRRALDLNPDAEAEVEAIQDGNSRAGKAERKAARRRAVRRKRATKLARLKAARRIDARLDTETRRRATVLAARRKTWAKLRKKRVAFYLAEAQRIAGGDKARAILLVRASERIHRQAKQQALASEELRREAEGKAKQARRYVKATYVHGLRLPEAAADAEQAERRLTEITLIAAYAELEAAWAGEAYKTNVTVWERFLAKNSR